MTETEKATEIVHEFVKNENLRKHMYAVAEAMRQYARKFGEDEEKWAVVGLLHDFDWEIHPNAEEHPIKGSEILKERGYSEEILRAILSHADYTGVTRESLMEKTLFAVDELSGFLVACALVQPSKKLEDVKVESVIKKMKKKEFARNVNRDDIINGAAGLGVELNEHIEFVSNALKGISGKLGM
ncbi:MAG: HDIG domain-containing protein [Ignavibacteria bacterium]|nr:HDIG domain-containing protein [Ignavibacteria bacterium]MCC7158231.1 HDIG domain-containing protein [Ignavibacteria bacterium]